MAGIATKTEIDTTWSMDDLIMANLALTYQGRMEEHAYQQAQREADAESRRRR